MSKKIVNPLLIAAAIAVNVVPGVGQLASIGLLSTTATTVIGTVTALGISAGLSTIAGIAGVGPKSPKATLSQLDRLNASINPSASRKFAFGRGPLGTDIRYVEPSGTDQEFIDYVIACAAHRVDAIDELWIDDLLAWTPGTGPQGKYAGYLTVTPVLEGNALNYVPINGGLKWGSTRRLTGCAYVHIRIKRTGNSKKAESPFVSGLSSRLTIVGNGAPVYDPRLDSTVPGGSGPQRWNNQSTWGFDASGLGQGRNLALQTLAYQIGWRIGGKLSVGAGTPVQRLNLPSYITAANICDEGILRADGTYEKRYTGAGMFGEDMEPAAVLDAQCVACNGAIRDAGGKLELIVRHNDLADVAVDLTDDDILGPGTWEPVEDLEQTYNVVRGRYVDPSANSLYQLVDYPEVRIATNDGVDRVLPLDLPLIDGAARAQRIAKQVLQRRQYRGKFSAEFGARAWNAKVGDIVRVTLSAAGWVNKPFRVEAQLISITGSCPMVLREESNEIYRWEADDRAPVQAAAPTRYNIENSPLILAVAEVSAEASQAQADATSALAQIGIIVSDGYLSREEKPEIIRKWQAIADENPVLETQAADLGVPFAAYHSATMDLGVYLFSLIPPFNDTTTSTAIVASVFNGYFVDYFYEKIALINAISAAAALRAEWAGVSAKPGNIAALDGSENINNVFVQAGENRVVNSSHARGTFGFIAGPNVVSGSGAYPTANSINNPGFYGQRQVLFGYVNTSGVPWNIPGDYHDPWVTRGAWLGGSADDVVKFGMPIKPGDRVYARALLARHRCMGRVYLLCFSESGVLREAPYWAGGRIGGAAYGNPELMDEVGGVYTITDAESRYACLLIRMVPTNEADPFLFATELAMGPLPVGQTVLPPYQDGPPDPTSDRTIEQPVVQYLNPQTGRLTSSLAFTTGQLFGIDTTVNVLVTATDQGGGTGVTITIPTHVRKFQGPAGPVSVTYNGATFTNQPYATRFLILAADENRVGGAVGYALTQNADDALEFKFVHVSTITTPLSGGGANNGSAGNGASNPPSYVPPGGSGGLIP